MKNFGIFIVIIGIILYIWGQKYVPYIVFGFIAATLLMIAYEKNKGWLE